MVRTVVVTTARATMKAARAMVAGATAVTMLPNSDKDNEDGICHHQQCRDIICRSKSVGKCNRQLIS